MRKLITAIAKLLHRRQRAVQSALTTGVALLFIVALLWVSGGITPALAGSGTPQAYATVGTHSTQDSKLPALTSTTRYVATNGSDAGNACTGPGSPCRTIQRAVQVADAGDLIRVAAGTYSGASPHPAPPFYQWPPASGVITQAVYISKTVTIQGGYTTTNWESANPDVNLTTLDAQGQGRVLYVTREISPTIVGLRITGGDATGLGGAWENAGGGAYIANTSVVFSRTHICDNEADWGGGVYVAAEGEVTLLSSTISSNTASEGAGLYAYRGTATLDGSTVSDNATARGDGLRLRTGPGSVGIGPEGLLGAPGSGGGIAGWVKSSLTIRNSSIVSNRADRGSGGGLSLNDSTATLCTSVVSGNSSTSKGGGAELWYNSGLVANNSTFRENAAREGGGLLVGYGSTATLINNFIADNEANSEGVALYVQGSSLYLLHNTIAGNRAGGGSGVYVTAYGDAPSTADLTNNILADHTVAIRVGDGATATLESTLWYGNPTDWNGTGNILRSNDYWGNPCFVDPGAGDYHITLTSAAKDKGTETDVDTDIDGDPRPLGPAADIGADEWTGFGLFVPLILRSFGP